MKRPVYEIIINEEEESFVDAIAFVDKPAIDSNFLAFKKSDRKEFSTNDERMELLGAAMIPDMLIFRKDERGSEYEVFFSKDTIRQIAQVFFKKGFQANLNLSHTEASANSYIYQSFIVDSTIGVDSPKELNLPDGSWVIGVKVTDVETWQKVKSGEMKGFSVEGIFQMIDASFSKVAQSEEDELLGLLQELNSLFEKEETPIFKIEND